MVDLEENGITLDSFWLSGTLVGGRGLLVALLACRLLLSLCCFPVPRKYRSNS